MKKILTALCFLSLFACTRDQDDDDNNPPPPPVPSDTLAAGWSKVPVQQRPVDIFFIGNTGFAAGNNLISRSVDGGKTWDSVFFRNGAFFFNISMGNTSRALFTTFSLPGAAQSELIRTLNGGNSFDTVYIPDGRISNVFFVSASVVYALGRRCWKSVDAGSTWQPLYDFGTAALADYKGLFFLNEQTGWATGANGLYKTTNGGVSWEILPAPSFDFSIGGNVFFVDANTGYAADSVRVGKTVNGGSSWTIQQNFAPVYHDIHFVSHNVGYLTSHNYIFKTTDGGATWKKEVALINNQRLYELHFTDADHGWACSEDHLILRYER